MIKKAYITIIGVFLLTFITTGCFSYVARYDGTYRGKVIDADTGEPIEGVVVLGVWNKGFSTPGGIVHEFYDARETVTDKNGEFEISGMGLRIISNLEPVDVLIFKAGYEHIGYMQWESLKEDILLRKKIKWEGNKPIIPLKKLTMEERKKRLIGKESIPDNKQKLLIRELNKEKRELGEPTYPEVE